MEESWFYMGNTGESIKPCQVKAQSNAFIRDVFLVVLLGLKNEG